MLDNLANIFREQTLLLVSQTATSIEIEPLSSLHQLDDAGKLFDKLLFHALHHDDDGILQGNNPVRDIKQEFYIAVHEMEWILFAVLPQYDGWILLLLIFIKMGNNLLIIGLGMCGYFLQKLLIVL